ncbi:hypothetical protein M413DRAFT_439045 [Hebeloma cylindrosporum]|uniref:F-box domain-containing protein n=1 Tax=Hebeloma cylindrosporum TaxID=76867 RepID=A0A0C3CMJ3_HEBCY|nr:hypothetical protein M413DRAFT_439045 [Hebeloma cylindrosporum h7]
MSVTLPSELIDAIIDQVALLDTTTLHSCALTSRAFVFPSQKHIFHTIDLDVRRPRAVHYLRFHRLLQSKPHLGAHVRRLRLVDDSKEDFAHGFSWMTHPRTPISRTLGFLSNLRSFELSFNSTGEKWSAVPEETRVGFGRVFAMESVREVALECVSGFPVALLSSLARLKYLALSNVTIDSDEGSERMDVSNSVTLEGLYLRGVSPEIIKILAKALSAPDTPPTLRKLALTPTFEEGFAEAVAKLIVTCGSHLTSFAWLPSIHFPSYIGPINISSLHSLRSLHFIVSFRKLSSQKPFAPTLALLLQISNRPNLIERITVECHCIMPRRGEGEKKLAKTWRPLDTVLSAEEGAIFRNLKEVEIVLSVNTILPTEIHRVVTNRGELLPRVEARGVVLTVRVDSCSQDSGFLERLREM